MNFQLKQISWMLITMICLFTACNKSYHYGQHGRLSGKVTDSETGASVEGVEVRISNLDLTDTTSQDGVFNFNNLSQCTLTVKCQRPGFDPKAIERVVIKANSTTELNVALCPSLAVGTRKVHKEEESKVGKTAPTEEIELKTGLVKEMKRKKTLLGISEPGESRSYCDESLRAVIGSALANTDISLNRCIIARGGCDEEAQQIYRAAPPFHTEEYDRIYENEFKAVMLNPLSTFSIDVDAASYSNIRRFINEGHLPPPDAVRIEEMINYFTYEYPQPDNKHPFSITTELSTCPWNEKNLLTHIGLQGRRITAEKLPAGNLVFLIDVSGSMQPANKLPLLKNAFRLLVNQLRNIDRVAIVVYAGSSGLVLESTPGNRKEKILEAIDRFQAGGSTNGGSGVQLAYKIAKRNFIEDGNNRVILATDGDFNVGVSSDAELVRMIEEKRKEGIYLTVLGFGCGNYKDSKMEQLADKGNGNFSYIDNIHEARKVLVSELGATIVTIAKDVKIQVEFNPALVKAYRLVGYENRMLHKEDFNDDVKDAGEMGAGHSVTALYEIVPVGIDVNLPKVDSLKYQQSIVSEDAFKSNELMTVKLRYKPPQEDVSKLLSFPVTNADIALEKTSDNFRFSAAVAEFGMLLRNSDFKGDASYDEVIEIARSAKGSDDEGYRAEMIKLVATCGVLAN